MGRLGAAPARVGGLLVVLLLASPFGVGTSAAQVPVPELNTPYYVMTNMGWESNEAGQGQALHTQTTTAGSKINFYPQDDDLQIDDLEALSYDRLIASGMCGGGSPRVTINLRGDAAEFAGSGLNVDVGENGGGDCPLGVWVSDDLMAANWATQQLGGAAIDSRENAHALARAMDSEYRIFRVDIHWDSPPYGDLWVDRFVVHDRVLREPTDCAGTAAHCQAAPASLATDGPTLDGQRGEREQYELVDVNNGWAVYAACADSGVWFFLESDTHEFYNGNVMFWSETGRRNTYLGNPVTGTDRLGERPVGEAAGSNGNKNWEVRIDSDWAGNYPWAYSIGSSSFMHTNSYGNGPSEGDAYPAFTNPCAPSDLPCDLGGLACKPAPAVRDVHAGGVFYQAMDAVGRQEFHYRFIVPEGKNAIGIYTKEKCGQRVEGLCQAEVELFMRVDGVPRGDQTDDCHVGGDFPGGHDPSAGEDVGAGGIHCVSDGLVAGQEVRFMLRLTGVGSLLAPGDVTKALVYPAAATL